jgi:UDP-N-acetylmuramoyl-L-alanyl-D-glutamate--2,6-diaminopimelate ligase
MDLMIEDFDFDSRKISSNSMFIAINGTQTDGHNYIDDVIKKGASSIVCEEFPEIIQDNITYIKVKNSAKSCGQIASNFYKNPSSKLNLIGITGTNGKTSTVTMLFNLFKELGYKVGLLSTVENRINSRIIEATHTTPDQKALNKMLAEMLEESCDYVFMEVSSHAIEQYRIEGLEFKLAIFSNITHDHLDYHKTFQNYITAKKKFFDNLSGSAYALVNNDDKHSAVMLQNCKANKRTFGLKSNADFKAIILESHFDGINLKINSENIWVPLAGKFNAYNILAVYAVAMILNQDKTEVLTKISNIKTAEGRFEYIKSDDGKFAIVDYAHTPDALENVLNTINEIRSKQNDLITVIGTGGNRDKSKRPIMTKIAVNASTKVILTSDNPRNENPEDILDDMLSETSNEDYQKILRITNRKEAIRTACALAKAGDIILVAGKGHEKYQEINGVKHHFDDKEIIKQNFKKQ